jgi:hypothetical protein
MRSRWKWLLACSITALAGMLWFASQRHVRWDAWLGAQLAGLAACVAIGGVVLERDVRVKWPAALALVCASPLADTIHGALSSLLPLISWFGLPIVLIVAGGAGTVALALAILIAPATEPRLARARVI